MYWQLGPWDQISVKLQTKRIFIHETEFEKINIKMVAILSLPQHVDKIILLFDNCTQYDDIDLNKWQKCAWFSIAHFLIDYGTQDVNKGGKVWHACESQGLTLRTFYQNHCIMIHISVTSSYIIFSLVTRYLWKQSGGLHSIHHVMHVWLILNDKSLDENQITIWDFVIIVFI